MKRPTLLLLFVPLVAIAMYGCEQSENPLETESQASETPLYAPGGGAGKVKAEPNPIGCTQDQVAKWDSSAGEWVCADDLDTQRPAAPRVFYAYVGSLGTDGHFVGTSYGVTSFAETNVTDFSIAFDAADILQCVPVLSPQYFSNGGPSSSYSVVHNESINGFDVHAGRVLGGTTTPYAVGVTVVAICSP